MYMLMYIYIYIPQRACISPRLKTQQIPASKILGPRNFFPRKKNSASLPRDEITGGWEGGKTRKKFARAREIYRVNFGCLIRVYKAGGTMNIKRYEAARAQERERESAILSPRYIKQRICIMIFQRLALYSRNTTAANFYGKSRKSSRAGLLLYAIKQGNFFICLEVNFAFNRSITVAPFVAKKLLWCL